MELKITGYNNFFKLKGVFNKSSLSLFESQFDNIFDRVDQLTISIESIEWMDRFGIEAFIKLHESSILKNKKLSIIGMGCKELYEHFTAISPKDVKADTAA